MNAIDLWNRAVTLSRPTIGDLETAAAVRSREVFADDPSLRSLVPNILVETAIGRPYAADEPVVNVILVFVSDFFQIPPQPGVLLSDLTGVHWGRLALPCGATQMHEYLSDIGGAPIKLLTESNGMGRVLAWKVRVGALTFEFEPVSEDPDPAKSRMISASFNFRIEYSFALSPTFGRP